MASLNEILGPASRLNQLLTRFFSTTGGAPSPQLTPEIVPSFPMIPDSDHDLRWIRRERTFGRTLNVTAAVGTAGLWQLRNPVNSGIIATVERVYVTSVGAAAQTTTVTAISETVTDLANVSNGLPRDGRDNVGSVRVGACIPSWNNNGAASIAGILGGVCLANVALIDENQYTIQPGQAVAGTAGGVNQQFLVTFIWRERPVSLGELQL